MAEKGVDISREIPQPWTDEIIRASDVVVTMGCGDTCPVFPGNRYLDWELQDPSGRPIDEVRGIRDDLEKRVRELLAELGVDPADIVRTYVRVQGRHHPSRRSRSSTHPWNNAITHDFEAGR